MGDLHYLHQSDPRVEREELHKAFMARIGLLIVKAKQNKVCTTMIYAILFKYLTRAMEMDIEMEEADKELIRKDLERYILNQRGDK